MLRFENFRFDYLSFIIGLIFATAIWWLFLKAKSWFPKIKLNYQRQMEENRRIQIAGIDAVYRHYLLSKSQHLHLANSIFSLDEIIIAPLLMAPPLYIVNPEGIPHSETIADQTLPYLPDWPELTAQYNSSKSPSLKRFKIMRILR
jgi:hypothetical protein